MQLSSWHVSEAGKLKCGKDPAVLKILHVEDHQLYFNGVRQEVSKFYPGSRYFNFQSDLEALEYYNKGLRSGDIPDLVISDINHPGIGGVAFVKELRKAESIFKVRTPVMILSMVDPGGYRMLVEENLIDYWLTKASSAEDILEGITRVVNW